MKTMNDDDLGGLLKNLPRHDASPEFTERLMERLDAPESQVMFVSRRWVAPAIVALLLGIVLGGAAWQNHRERRETAARVEAERFEMMRNEYRALERELDELRSLASDVQPVLELGGTEDVDFIVDLSRLARERARMRATPTSHSSR